jgi:hypothetical protein
MALIVPLANEARKNANNKAIQENERVLTYQNKNQPTETFQIGEVVRHKQLQVMTGTNMGMKSKFTGPYVITALYKHELSATIKNLSNGRTIVVERSIESRGKTGKGLVRPDQSFSGFAPAFDASFF